MVVLYHSASTVIANSMDTIHIYKYHDMFNG